MKIYKEVPSGAIDGVNKVFTFVNNIDYIDDLWVDNVIYTSFSISGNTVTLTDAPTLDIYADYMPAGSEIPVTTEITYGDMKSKVWTLLGQKSTSTNFSNDIVGDEINILSLEVWRGRVVNLLNPQQVIRAGNLWFQEGNTSLRVKAGGIVTDPVSFGDTEITASTTNLLPSGYALIGGDIINYTGKTSTQLTGVTGITTSHLTGDKITQLYPVPANFETMIGLDYVFYGSNGVYYQEVPLNNGLASYQIMRVGANVYLKINGFQDNTEIRVRYAKKYDDLVNDTDICPFPDKYGVNVVSFLVAGTLAYDKGMPTAERLLNRAYGNLRSMYSYFTNETKVIKQRIQPKHYSFNTRLGGNIIR